MHDRTLLSSRWAVWVFAQSRSRGVRLAGVRTDGRGGSVPCEPGEVFVHALSPELCTRIEQRPGCSGLLTTLRFEVAGRLVGAWIQDRRPGEPESPAWAQLLVEALVLAARAPQPELPSLPDHALAAAPGVH